ncbi:MAG TPA: polyprenyl synthetase family protein, partial [Kofleriaceae bacterium]|nr:polyprenyl synthetase family protein [Kofleriaceae bacterium]
GRADGGIVTKLAIAAAPSQALDALERALSPGGASALDPAVPAALWRRALAGPAHDFLGRPGKALRSSIVRGGWMLGGGAPAAFPDALALVLELLHAGSLIIDDIEDGATERRGAPALHSTVGVPLAINTGSWMYFWALAELERLDLPPARRLAAHRTSIATLVRCHQGQALDLAITIADLDPTSAGGIVSSITRLKAGALCRLAGELGAIAAGAEPSARDAIADFAESAGCALQMLDDLGSIASPARRDKGHEDLCGGRPTWPWAWLAEVAPFAWARLAGAAAAVSAGHGDADALADALAAQTASFGRGRIRSLLDGALTRLTGALGESAAIDVLAGELARMEVSYV